MINLLVNHLEMEFLPIDVIYLILEELNYSTLVHLRRVNKRFLSLIKQRYQSNKLKFRIEDNPLLLKLAVNDSTFIMYFYNTEPNFPDYIADFDQRQLDITYEFFDYSMDQIDLLINIDQKYFCLQQENHSGYCRYSPSGVTFKFKIKGRELAILQLLKYIHKMTKEND